MKDGDLPQQAGERRCKPRSLGLPGRDQCRKALREPCLHLCRRFCPPVRFVGLRRSQHAGEAEQRLGARHRAAGDAPVQIERQRKRLFQRRGVGNQPRLVLALDREVGGDVAALQHLADRLAQGGLQRVPAGRQTQAQIEPLPLTLRSSHAQDRPAALPSVPGESSHRGEGGAHVARLLSVVRGLDMLADGSPCRLGTRATTANRLHGFDEVRPAAWPIRHRKS